MQFFKIKPIFFSKKKMTNSTINIKFNSQKPICDDFKCINILKNINTIIQSSKKSYKKTL